VRGPQIPGPQAPADRAHRSPETRSQSGGVRSSRKGAAKLVPSEAFSVRVESSNGAAHLRLSGRFDLAAVSSLDDLIGETQRLDVVMDLGDVTFMDGAAWLAVMDFEHRAHDWGKELLLVNTPAPVRRIFELTASDHLIADTDRPPNGRGVRPTTVTR
jgi:anti-anti-sigma factor